MSHRANLFSPVGLLVRRVNAFRLVDVAVGAGPDAVEELVVILGVPAANVGTLKRTTP